MNEIPHTNEKGMAISRDGYVSQKTCAYGTSTSAYDGARTGASQSTATKREARRTDTSVFAHSVRTGGLLAPPDINILQQIADGYSYLDISQNTGIPWATLKNRVRMVYAKLGACNRAHAIAQALRKGLIR